MASDVKYKTRRSSGHFAFGQPSVLPNGVLPLDLDVFNYYQYLRKEESTDKSNTVRKIAQEVIDLWKEKGNIPTMGFKGVEKKVNGVLKRGNDLLKVPKDRRQKMADEMEELESDRLSKPVSANIGRKKKLVNDTLTGLFDICWCKHISREDCSCPS